MNEAQRQVLEFHEAFELGAPGSLEEGNFPAELRIRLIEEEASEFAEAARRVRRDALVAELRALRATN